MKRIKQVCMAAALALVAVLALPQLAAGAQAADTAKCGAYYSYVQQDGLYVQGSAGSSAKQIVAPTTGHKVSSCVADSTYIYYTAASVKGTSSSLYRIKPNGTGKKRIAKIVAKNVTLLDTGTDTVYYSITTKSGKVNTRRYGISKGRSYSVKTDFVGDQYSNGYLVGTPKTTAGKATSLYTVRGLTNDYVRVSRNCVAYQIINSKIYFAESTAANKISAVKYCDLNGKNIRTLATNIKNVNLKQVVPTKTMLYYTSSKTTGRVNGYSFSTKKATKILSGLSSKTTVDYLGSSIIVQNPKKKFYTVKNGSTKATAQGSLGSGTVTNIIGNTYFKKTGSSYSLGTIAG